MQLTLVILFSGATTMHQLLIQGCSAGALQACGYIQGAYCCMLTPCVECLHLHNVSTAFAKEDLLMKKTKQRTGYGAKWV